MKYKGFDIDDNMIDKYVEALGCSIEEACIQILEEDGRIEESPETKQAVNVKEGKRRYEKSGKPRKPSTKERKVDENKKYLLEIIKNALENDEKCANFSVKTETEVNFTYCEANYTVKLTKHRPKKA